MTPTIRNPWYVVYENPTRNPLGPFATEDAARGLAELSAHRAHVARLFIVPPPYRMKVTGTSTPSNWAPSPR